ncbi:cupin [Vandammella animalimorsus]|uniref:Cupin n=2 Tax=Vandammella animalimorsus TaxID=2029117 RepID=A0A2A2A7J6_9BURK|nr:cupin [Vandammella animalimorsus]
MAAMHAPIDAPFDAPISLQETLAQLREHWKPLILNRGDFGLRFVRFVGDFEWHSHAHSDKAVLVLSGEMGIRFKDAAPVRIRAGELFVMPKGVEHQPHAEQECAIVLIERAGQGD